MADDPRKPTDPDEVPTKKTSGLMRAVKRRVDSITTELERCPSIGPAGLRCERPVNHHLMSDEIRRHVDRDGRTWE